MHARVFVLFYATVYLQDGEEVDTTGLETSSFFFFLLHCIGVCFFRCHSDQEQHTGEAQFYVSNVICNFGATFLSSQVSQFLSDFGTEIFCKIK